MTYASHCRWLWSEKQVQILREMWPHWGSARLSEILNLTEQQIKSKVDKLSLKMLPKEQRKCVSCEIGYQKNRTYGLYCRGCYLNGRKEKRKLIQKPTKVWMKELLRTLKYRSKEPCSLTIEYLESLWILQNKLCVYTGKQLKEPNFYGSGRDFDTASIDRVDSTRGYIIGNVVWCCWGCNIGKLNFSIEEYIDNCERVFLNKEHIKKQLYLIKNL